MENIILNTNFSYNNLYDSSYNDSDFSLNSRHNSSVDTFNLLFNFSYDFFNLFLENNEIANEIQIENESLVDFLKDHMKDRQKDNNEIQLGNDIIGNYLDDHQKENKEYDDSEYESEYRSEEENGLELNQRKEFNPNDNTITRHRIIQINSIIGKYNHDMNSLVGEIALKYQKLTDKMIEKVKFWTIQGKIGISTQYNLLVTLFSDKVINKKDLNNAIQQFKKQAKPNKNDALVDNNFKSLIVAAAVLEDETEATFSKKLKGKLHNQFELFHAKFLAMCNSLCHKKFEIEWKALTDEFPACEQYLTRVLYPCKCSWANYASVGTLAV
ncbi:hypothetical protein C1646_774890 [Rhizophagus diaphanus]|nr:hypothetical protein C1646_774890 [Rhizophagus diaphanus] [Rhizophagus sp. MUCL 43196]